MNKVKLSKIAHILERFYYKPKNLIKYQSKYLEKLLLPRSLWQLVFSFSHTRQQNFLLKMETTPITGQPQKTSRKVLGTKPKNISTTKKKGLSRLPVESLHAIKIRTVNGLYTFWENKRLRWGLLILLIAAPFVKYVFLLFPEDGFGDYFIKTNILTLANTIEGPDNGWYWGLIRMYVFSNGELIAPVLLIFGIFLLFPKKYYPSYLVGIPFGYYLSMSAHRLFYVNSNQSFNSGFTTTITLMFLLLGVIAFIISDKILFKQNFQKKAVQDRIVGLINMPGMNWEEKEVLLKTEAQELIKIDNELFIKKSA